MVDSGKVGEAYISMNPTNDNSASLGGNLNQTESLSQQTEGSGILLTPRTINEFNRFGHVYYEEA